MHLAYIWIISHLSAKNYRNWWKFDEVLTKTNLLSFFWDTVVVVRQTHKIHISCHHTVVTLDNTEAVQKFKVSPCTDS